MNDHDDLKNVSFSYNNMNKAKDKAKMNIAVSLGYKSIEDRIKAQLGKF